MLIKIYFGKIQEPLDLVRPDLLRLRGDLLIYRFLTHFYNTDTPDSLYDLSDNCFDMDISLSYEPLRFRNVSHSALLFPKQR